MKDCLPSVVDYLTSKGFKFVRRGSKDFTNSPFNPNDRTPSFAVFQDGGFKCFSTGKAGNIYTLLKHFGDTEGSISITPIWTPPPERKLKPWKGCIPQRYLDITEEERLSITQYAASRAITKGFECGVAYHQEGGKFVKSGLAVLYPHFNELNDIIGAKFRFITPTTQRFTCRGKLGFYILENLVDGFEEPSLFVVEGEGNANSLWSHFVDVGKPAVILSAGAVTQIPKRIPERYKNLKKHLIIDYDGLEEKYLERLELYKHLELLPIRLKLPKGQDINSLYANNSIEWIENLL